jgi:hypothetical protein
MTKFGPAALVPGYQSDMPGFNHKLTDADIWAVLSYIESTWPADIRVRQQKMNERKTIAAILSAGGPSGHGRIRPSSSPDGAAGAMRRWRAGR